MYMYTVLQLSMGMDDLASQRTTSCTFVSGLLSRRLVTQRAPRTKSVRTIFVACFSKQSLIVKQSVVDRESVRLSNETK